MLEQTTPGHWCAREPLAPEPPAPGGVGGAGHPPELWHTDRPHSGWALLTRPAPFGMACWPDPLPRTFHWPIWDWLWIDFTALSPPTAKRGGSFVEKGHRPFPTKGHAGQGFDCLRKSRPALHEVSFPRRMSPEMTKFFCSVLFGGRNSVKPPKPKVFRRIDRAFAANGKARFFMSCHIISSELY